MVEIISSIMRYIINFNNDFDQKSLWNFLENSFFKFSFIKVTQPRKSPVFKCRLIAMLLLLLTSHVYSYIYFLFRTQIIMCKTFRAVAFVFRWFFFFSLTLNWTAMAVVVLKLYSKRSNFFISASNFNIQFYVWFYSRVTW